MIFNFYPTVASCSKMATTIDSARVFSDHFKIFLEIEGALKPLEQIINRGETRSQKGCW